MASLVGLQLPGVRLASTTGETINVGTLSGRTVFIIYPYTGRPGVSDPPGWDDITGAHGSTPQLLAFSDKYAEFITLGMKLFGISFQDSLWQQEFVTRNALLFPLLSDLHGEFSKALSLCTFEAGEIPFLARRTLVADAGLITHDIQDIPKPADNAADILRLLSS